jgi:hypothetical protein
MMRKKCNTTEIKHKILICMDNVTIVSTNHMDKHNTNPTP